MQFVRTTGIQCQEFGPQFRCKREVRVGPGLQRASAGGLSAITPSTPSRDVPDINPMIQAIGYATYSKRSRLSASDSATSSLACTLRAISAKRALDAASTGKVSEARATASGSWYTPLTRNSKCR